MENQRTSKQAPVICKGPNRTQPGLAKNFNNIKQPMFFDGLWRDHRTADLTELEKQRDEANKKLATLDEGIKRAQKTLEDQKREQDIQEQAKKLAETMKGEGTAA